MSATLAAEAVVKAGGGSGLDPGEGRSAIYARTVTAVAVLGLLPRLSGRSAGGARGVEELARVLSERLGVEPLRRGEPGPAGPRPWEEDLASAREALRDAGALLDVALAGGRTPALLAPDCTVAIGTLPTVGHHDDRTRVLWLDAHGDFNTPRTTTSGFLGGMPLSGATGRWRTGHGSLAEDRVVLAGVRDLDVGEREELEASNVALIEAPPGELAAPVVEALGGAPMFVHLDPDILDPALQPALFPVPGGLGLDGLRDLLATVAAASPVVGVEVAAFEAPEDPAERRRLAEGLADALAPLLG